MWTLDFAYIAMASIWRRPPGCNGLQGVPGAGPLARAYAVGGLPSWPGEVMPSGAAAILGYAIDWVPTSHPMKVVGR
jgi:hypothetical protein